MVDAAGVTRSTKHTWLSPESQRRKERRWHAAARSETCALRPARWTTKIAPASPVGERLRTTAAEPCSRMYFVTLRLSDQSRIAVSSISSTLLGRRIIRRYRASTAPARNQAREAARRRQRTNCSRQGWRGSGEEPVRSARGRRALPARASANAPMATTSDGFITSTTRVKASLHAEQRLALGCRKQLGRRVPARLFHEYERAPVRDVRARRSARLIRSGRVPSPSSGCRLLRSDGSRTDYRPPRMLHRWPDGPSMPRKSPTSRRRRTARPSAPSRTAPGSSRPSAPRGDVRSIALEVRLVRDSRVGRVGCRRPRPTGTEARRPARELPADADEASTRTFLTFVPLQGLSLSVKVPDCSR